MCVPSCSLDPSGTLVRDVWQGTTLQSLASPVRAKRCDDGRPALVSRHRGFGEFGSAGEVRGRIR